MFIGPVYVPLPSHNSNNSGSNSGATFGMLEHTKIKNEPVPPEPGLAWWEYILYPVMFVVFVLLTVVFIAVTACYFSVFLDWPVGHLPGLPK